MTPWPWLDDPALRVRDAVLAYRDLLFTAAASGELETVLENASRAEAHLRAYPDGVSAEKLNARALEFRRATHLESGEDFRAWLSLRSLSGDDFRTYLRRLVTLAGEPADGEGAGSPREEKADAAATGELAFKELAFRGSWRAFAKQAAELRTAESLVASTARPVSQSLPDTRGPTSPQETDPARILAILALLTPLAPFDERWCAERLVAHDRAVAALEEIERQVAGSDAVARRVAERSLEWTAFSFDELSLGSRGAALEALSLAREDGLSAHEVAKCSGGELRRSERLREVLTSETATALDQAGEGEAVGPLDKGATVSVLWLRERRRPQGDDPEARERAVAELVEERLRDAMAGLVTEMGPL